MASATADDVLGPLERRVMTQLWRAGPSVVADVLGALNAHASTTLAYTTVMTVLTRLFEKGYVNRTKDGRGFRYSAAVDEPSIQALAARRELRRLVKRFGEAPVAAFAADLAGADPELVQRLRDLASSTDATHEP
ncbi:MAG: BlaI/MecI/CopY family transcriptional regulator [Candidatus Limnocylindrales bacterium]